MNNSAKLTQGDIKKSLIKLTIPMIFGLISILLFNVVDTFYIGQIGATELAAIGFTFPVTFIIMSIVFGIGIGTSSTVAKAIGKNKTSEIKKLTTHGLILSFILALFFAIIGLLTIEPVFKLLGAEDNLIDLIKQYMQVWYIAIPLLVVPIVGNSAIRATGDTKTPAIVMSVAGFGNAILDPFLIFGIGPFPRLELQGAALASAISWILVFIAAFYVLGKREKILELTCNPKELIDSWKKILFIGLPAIGTNVLVPLSLGIITRMISNFGEEAVAGFGVASRIESLATIPIMAMSAVMIPIIGQNFGAKKYDRVKLAIYHSIKLSLLWGAIMTIILVILANPIATLFNKNLSVIKTITLFLYIVTISYGLSGISVLISSSYNGLQKPIKSATIIIVKMFVLTIPLAYLGSIYYGLFGLFIGISLSNILIGLVSIFMIRRSLEESCK